MLCNIFLCSLSETLISMISMTSWTLNSDPKLEQEMIKMRRKCSALLDKLVARQSLEDSEDSQRERESCGKITEVPEYEVDAENFTVRFIIELL